MKSAHEREQNKEVVLFRRWRQQRAKKPVLKCRKIVKIGYNGFLFIFTYSALSICLLVASFLAHALKLIRQCFGCFCCCCCHLFLIHGYCFWWLIYLDENSPHSLEISLKFERKKSMPNWIQLKLNAVPYRIILNISL